MCSKYTFEEKGKKCKLLQLQSRYSIQFAENREGLLDLIFRDLPERHLLQVQFELEQLGIFTKIEFELKE